MATSAWSEGIEVLAPLRAGNPQAPNALSFLVSRSVTIDDVTDPGEVIHVLPEVREPTGRYRNGMIVTVDGRATTLILAASDGRAARLTVFTDDGGATDIATSVWSPEGWEDFAIALARTSLERRNGQRANDSGAGLVAAADHVALREFMARSGHHIGIRTWRVESDQAFPGLPRARLEIWTAITAVGPISYARMAAAYQPDGTIAGLAAVEAMPSMHDSTYLCMFAPDGNHQNLGSTTPDRDFPADAIAVLKPLLAPEPPSHPHPPEPDTVAPHTVSNSAALVLRHAARSDRGLVELENEDSTHAGLRVLAIADGMSQRSGGKVASTLVIQALAALDDDHTGSDLLGVLHTAVLNGNAAIAAELARRPELTGMATTLTAILFAGNQFGLAHLGDTRCYLLRHGQVVQLTRDDSVVQVLIDHGQLTAEQANAHPQRAQLTRTLNGQPVEPPLTSYEAIVGDRYLLCSRGLSGPVGIDRIYDSLRIRDVGRSADRLIELAMQAGGQDNVTVIVADVVDDATQ